MNSEYQQFQTVLYVGMGLGLLCVAAVILIQMSWYRKGKSTGKELNETMSTAGWIIACCGFMSVASVIPDHSPTAGILLSLVYVGVCAYAFAGTYLIVGRLLSEGGAVVEYVWLLVMMVFVTFLIMCAAHTIADGIPFGDWTRGIVVFVGTLAGMVTAHMRLARREEQPESADADKVTIIRAGWGN